MLISNIKKVSKVIATIQYVAEITVLIRYLLLNQN